MNSLRLHLCSLVLASFAFGSLLSATTPSTAVVDDFADAQLTTTGAPRLLIDDKAMGSQSKAEQTSGAGTLTVKGELVPGRGVPAFISLVLLASPEGKPQDRAAFQGVRARVKINKGMISLQVGSSEITNYDYHTSAPLVGKRGEFHELRVPFAEMKRAWSEQTVLNTKSITSINLVVFGMAKDTFAYEVDEVGFY